jgi:hypothetical protein
MGIAILPPIFAARRHRTPYGYSKFTHPGARLVCVPETGFHGFSSSSVLNLLHCNMILV